MIDNGLVLLAEQRCREASSLEALAFTIANETWQLLPYRQAQVWRRGSTGPVLLAVSGLATLSEDSPFTVWLRRLVDALWPNLAEVPQLLNLAEIDSDAGDSAESRVLPAAVVSGWQEWWPAHLVAGSQPGADGRRWKRSGPGSRGPCWSTSGRLSG